MYKTKENCFLCWISRKYIQPESRQTGEVEMTCIVRKGEEKPRFAPESKNGLFLYKDLDKMCALTGAQPIFLDAPYASTVPDGSIGGQTQITLYNDHLSYTIASNSIFMFENETANRKRKNHSDDLIALATKHLQQGQSRFEKIAEAWAVQLEEMKPQQRIFAEKFISDILFEGKMGTLHRNAISFNTSSACAALSGLEDTTVSYVNDVSLANNKQTATEIKEELVQDDIDITERKLFT